jgi:hypothetical protein
LTLVEFPMVRLATPKERLDHGALACAMTKVYREGPNDEVFLIEMVIVDDSGSESIGPTPEDRCIVNISHESIHAATALIGEEERYPGGPSLIDVVSRDERAAHGFLSRDGITGGCSRNHWSSVRRQRRRRFLLRIGSHRDVLTHSMKPSRGY